MRRRMTQAEWIESRLYVVRDAVEALQCALDMRDWDGVRKYANQCERAEREGHRAQFLGPKRLRRFSCQVDLTHFRRTGVDPWSLIRSRPASPRFLLPA